MSKKENKKGKNNKRQKRERRFTKKQTEREQDKEETQANMSRYYLRSGCNLRAESVGNWPLGAFG